MAMSNALALMHGHDFGFLHGDFTSSGFTWLLIGILLVIVVISALAMEAALVLHAPIRLRSRDRRPDDLAKSAVAVSPNQTDLDSSSTPG